MPNKKQSARPAESGWLLEVGVIGIDKTLKIIKTIKAPLLEIEWAFREMKDYGRVIRGGNPGSLTTEQKKLLPWKKIRPLPPDRKEWPGIIGLFLGFEAGRKHQKGKKEARLPREKPHRRALMDWRLSKEDAVLVAPPTVARLIDPILSERGQDLKKLKRIRACSLVLNDALKVISGSKPELESAYSPEVEASLRPFGKWRQKLEEIVSNSKDFNVRGSRSRKP